MQVCGAFHSPRFYFVVVRIPAFSFELLNVNAYAAIVGNAIRSRLSCCRPLTDKEPLFFSLGVGMPTSQDEECDPH